MALRMWHGFEELVKCFPCRFGELDGLGNVDADFELERIGLRREENGTEKGRDDMKSFDLRRTSAHFCI
jgi:hypothetical protein